MFKQAIKLASALLIGSIAARLFALLFRYTAMTTLEVEDYAKLSIYISQYLTLLPLATVSMSTTLSKLLVNQSDQNKNVILFQAGLITLIGSIVAGLLYGLIDAWPTINDFDWLIVSFVLSSYLCAGFLSLKVGSELARGSFNKVAIIEFSESALRFFALLSVFSIGLVGAHWFFYSFLFGAPLLLILVSTLSIIKRPLFISSRGNKGNNIYSWLLFSHSGSLAIISLLTLGFALWLRYRLLEVSLAAVAFFDVALVLYSVPRLVFASVVRPVVPLAAGSDKKRVILIKPRKAITLFLFFSAAILCIYTVDLVQTIFGWFGLSQYISAVPTFLILLILSPLDLLFGYFSAFLQGVGKIQYVTMSVAISAGLAILPAFILTSAWGAAGAALSLGLFYFFACVSCAFVAVKTVGLGFSE